MDDQFTPPTQPSIPQKNSSAKGWVIISIVLVLAITIGFILQARFRQNTYTEENVPVVTPPIPVAIPPIPVVTPPIKDIKEVKEYTTDRPIPSVEKDASAGDVDATQEHTRGNPNARISIVEYANMTHEYPRIIHPDLKQFIEVNPNVNWIFRHYPIPENEMDYPIAYMSECVFRQSGDNAFWEYLDAVYETIPTDPKQMFTLAEPMVSDSEELIRCYENIVPKDDVKDDKILAVTEGKMTVLPTFFFVDHETGQERAVLGIDTMDFFQDIVNTMLAVEM